MATAEEIRTLAARRLRRALLGLAAVGLLVAGGVVWLVVRGPAGAPAHAPERTPAAVASKPAPASPVNDGSSFVAPARWVTLPPGDRLVEEIPVGFPHTPAGAAGVAVAAVTYGWTADPATASRVARLYTAPEYAAGSAQRAADAATAWRTRLGLPPSGPPPAQVGVSARLVGVRWHQQDPDRVRVSVLAEVREYPAAGGPVRRSMVAITAELVWATGPSGSDWQLVPSNGPLPTPPPTGVGTSGFNEAGWVAIGRGR